MCSQAENQNVDSVEEKENIATEQQAETVVENNDEATKVEDAETLLKINKLTEDLAAAKDEVLRAQAEVANMRRRCEQEVDELAEHLGIALQVARVLNKEILCG